VRRVQPETGYLVFTSPGNHDAFEGWDRVCVTPRPRFWRRPASSAAAGLVSAVCAAGLDVLFSPLASAPMRTPVPLVVCALDLRPWEPAAPRKDRPLTLAAARRVCARAAGAVAPSAYVQRRLLELLETPMNKTVVAPFGVDPLFGMPQPCVAPRPFLLFVGRTGAAKNIPRLRESFDLLRKELPHALVVAGPPGEAEPADWGPRVFRFERCPTEVLAGLCQQCAVFIQPSLHEGSGVTVLEAMRAGAPVAASRTGGIEEVAADLPFYFNAESAASIAITVRRALDEPPDLQQTRAKAGRKLAAEYTWDKCAWKILSAFKRALA